MQSSPRRPTGRCGVSSAMARSAIWLPGRANIPPAYLLVWVADDGEDGDGDAVRDSNSRVMLRVEAYGGAGAHRSIEAIVMLQVLAAPPPADGSPPPPARTAVRVLSSREVR